MPLSNTGEQLGQFVTGNATKARVVGKRMQVLEHLREQITCGMLPPGSRLPTRDELVEQLGVSRATVQNAMDSLIAHGFIRTSGSRGTFVSERPPNLSNFALVFPVSPSGNGHWSRFYQAMLYEAQKRVQTQERSLQVYCTAGGDQQHPEFLRLRQDVENRKLAGVIFGTLPFEYIPTGLLQRIAELKIAGVCVTTEKKFGFPAISVDDDSFVKQALCYLRDAGRKRLAIFMPLERSLDTVLQLAQQNGITVQRHRVHEFYPKYPRPAEQVVELLMRLPADDRPDSILIMDDHLCDSVVAGLIRAKVSVPEEVTVVSHVNFPVPGQPPLPIQRIGFDAGAVITTCFETLDKLIAGQAVPDVTLVAAQMEQAVARQPYDPSLTLPPSVALTAPQRQ